VSFSTFEKLCGVSLDEIQDTNQARRLLRTCAGHELPIKAVSPGLVPYRVALEIDYSDSMEELLRPLRTHL
jgi:hypothetical protein